MAPENATPVGTQQMDCVTAERQIIARLRAVLLPVATLGIAVAVGFFSYVWYLRLSGELDSYSTTGMATAGIFLAISRAPHLVRTWRQFLFDGRNAVWLRGGQLVFLHPEYFAVRCADIADIKRDADIYGYHEAAFLMRDGSNKKVSLYYLAGKPDVLIERMRQACGLPEPVGESVEGAVVLARGAWHRAAVRLIPLGLAVGLAFGLGTMPEGTITSILIVCAGLAIMVSLWLIVHAVLHSICSIWIAKGKLHLNWRDHVFVEQVEDAVLQNIEKSLFGVTVTRTVIMVRLRGGKMVHSAPAGTFTEPARAVLARLRAALATT